MDELLTLKRFREGIAGAPVDDPVRQQTMAALRALIAQEAASNLPLPAARRLRLPSAPRFSRRRIAVVAALAAAIALVLATLPGRRSGGSLVGEAIAALGSGGVLHVVGQMPTGREIVDLTSGTATPVMQQEEIWFDQQRGLRRDVTRIGSVIVDDTFQSQAGGWTPHGVIYDCSWIAAHPMEATKARVSCNASGDNGTTPRTLPRPKPTLDPGLAGFADSYRDALASGAAREAGSGVVDGETVDWLVFTTSGGDERVALDATTHKPVLLDGPNGLQLKISRIETADAPGTAFEEPSPSEIPVQPSRGESKDEQTLALDAAALGAAYPDAVWAGTSINGLPLASATVQHLATSYNGLRPQIEGEGLQLQYGPLLANGHRDFTKPYVTISEAPNADLAMGYGWFMPRISLAPGQLYLQPMASGSDRSTSLAVGFLFTNDRAIVIQASGDDLALAAARALTPTR